jgi:hypothetical protein
VTTSNAAAPITVDGLAQVTAILNYCSHVDRPDADRYERALIISSGQRHQMKGDESSLAGSAARSAMLLNKPPGQHGRGACRIFSPQPAGMHQ